MLLKADKSNSMKQLLTNLILSVAIIISTVNAQTLQNSYSLATATIYLDMDGENVNSPVWNNGTPFTAAAPVLTTTQKDEIFKRVAEDYRPFNLNITTDVNTYLSAPITNRVRVIVTSTSAWFPGVGGIAFVGSFTWGDDTPCFVFADRLGNSTKYVAECCSHESGHTLGLSHQSKYDGACNLTASYNEGIGTGEAAWAPIMGNSYYRNMSGWNNGPTPYGCSSNQDNLSIITTQNGFSYRNDDYSDDINANPTLVDITSFNLGGVITTANDKDFLKFSIAENSNVLLNANPYKVGNNSSGANLDIKLSLYDKNKTLIRLYDPAATMNATIDTILEKGDYYLMIDGTGNMNTTDYGSLGSYTIDGLAKILPINSASLTANITNNKHELNWVISSEADIADIVVEYSINGADFNALVTLPAGTNSYTNYQPMMQNVYYRIKAEGYGTQYKYSNVVSIKNNDGTNNFKVATLVQSNISIDAKKSFSYLLVSTSGQAIKTGRANAGLQRIIAEDLRPGIYFLELLSEGKREIIKIFKQ